jgi:DNA (cytosine-5)-methyltransferase 1
MISILGDYNYTFPKPIPLEKKLKDMLEDNVDEKYYLSEKMLDYCMGINQKESKFPRGERFLQSLEQTNNKDIATTITTNAGNRPTDNFIKIKNATKQGYLEATDGDGIDISSRMEYHRGTVQKNKTQTITTMGGENNGAVSNDLRIRKLTPKECFRLMGVKDEDFEKCAKNQSDSSLYHLAGDSIVVNVLMAIFKEMIN